MCQDKNRFSVARSNQYLFYSMDQMLFHRRITSSIKLTVPIQTPAWREALQVPSVLHKNTLQCPLPELKPTLLDLEMIITNHEATMTNKLIQNALIFFKGTRMNRQFGMFFVILTGEMTRRVCSLFKTSWAQLSMLALE